MGGSSSKNKDPKGDKKLADKKGDKKGEKKSEKKASKKESQVVPVHTTHSDDENSTHVEQVENT